jgi:hypothetical protein
MDPATIIGLIASLSSLSVNVIKAINQYKNDINAAPREAAELQHEIQTIKDVVEGVDQAIKAMPNSTVIPLDDSLQLSAEGAVNVLKEVLRTLEERSALWRCKGFRKMKWPFEKKETMNLIDKLQRYKQSLSLIVQIKQTYSPFDVYN